MAYSLTIHRGRKTERGYRVEHFATAFRHYLPEFPTRERASVRKKHDRHRKPVKAHGCTVGGAEVTAERARLSRVRSLLSSLAAISLALRRERIRGFAVH
jgi:hypothetical protein